VVVVGQQRELGNTPHALSSEEQQYSRTSRLCVPAGRAPAARGLGGSERPLGVVEVLGTLGWSPVVLSRAMRPIESVYAQDTWPLPQPQPQPTTRSSGCLAHRGGRRPGGGYMDQGEWESLILVYLQEKG